MIMMRITIIMMERVIYYDCECRNTTFAYNKVIALRDASRERVGEREREREREKEREREREREREAERERMRRESKIGT